MKSPASSSRVAIIGGGWAGLAAAVELAQRNIPVTLFEASKVLGGRARRVSVHGQVLDNGQHILIGAYRETLRLMRRVGIDPEQQLLRQPLHLEYPGELRIHAARLPAPWHLASALFTAQGLGWQEKLAALRAMQALKSWRFQLKQDMSVAQLLDRLQQHGRLRSHLWEALCIAALNTPPDIASAQTFLYVLRDTLATTREASDLLLPRTDLSELFPETAARHLAQHHAPSFSLLRNHSIRQISLTSAEASDQPAYLLQATNRQDSEQATQATFGPYSQIILAVAPQHLGALIQTLPGMEALRRILSDLHYQPIITGYLAYPAPIRLPQPMLGLAGGCLQWLFDRGQLNGPKGLLAGVVSAAGHLLADDQRQLSARIHEEIRRLIPGLPAPSWSQIIREKRATWAASVGLQRPSTITGLPGLFLAGDYVSSANNPYPATFEAAVRSGMAAAAQIP